MKAKSDCFAGTVGAPASCSAAVHTQQGLVGEKQSGFPAAVCPDDTECLNIPALKVDVKLENDFRCSRQHLTPGARLG